MESLIDLDEDVLESIFGIFMVLQYAFRDSINHGPVALHEFGKCCFVTPPSHRKQFMLLS
jgi:hypothetical protein